MADDEIVNDAPDGAEVVDVESVPDTGSLEAELDRVLKADKLAAVADGTDEAAEPAAPGAPPAPAPGTPEARSAERIAKAKAAERRVQSGVGELDNRRGRTTGKARAGAHRADGGAVLPAPRAG